MPRKLPKNNQLIYPHFSEGKKTIIDRTSIARSKQFYSLNNKLQLLIFQNIFCSFLCLWRIFCFIKWLIGLYIQCILWSRVFCNRIPFIKFLQLIITFDELIIWKVYIHTFVMGTEVPIPNSFSSKVFFEGWTSNSNLSLR